MSSSAAARKLDPTPDSFVPADAVPTDDVQRLRRFGEEIDRIRDRIEAEVGPEDLQYVRRLNWFSRGMEVIGRVLIHFSLDPITFGAGVIALWLHKQLQATEIGHTALHGAYDKLDAGGKFDSKKYAWDIPIDEETWKVGHNVKHHQYTNIAGKDPDIHFGPVRLTEDTPHKKHHRWQLPFALFVMFPNFTLLMNTHFTGLHDVWFGNDRGGMDVLKDRSPESVRGAYKNALRKYVPYYLKNYVFFPLLAGPMFWKVLLGNWMAETMRDIYSAATIWCGHIGAETAAYPEGTRAHGRGEWYAMQAEASNNYEVSLPVSMLCGGLDRQIEHHMFPKLPPQRIREIAPEIRETCEKYGVRYNTASWGKTLKKALGRIKELSSASPSAGVRGVTSVVREMM